MREKVVRDLAIPPQGSAGIAAVTLDLHEGDAPDDIQNALESLSKRDIRATFFIPTGMLDHAKYRAPLHAIAAGGHEPASHSHRHDYAEIQALIAGGPGTLGFLAQSKAIHEDFFGSSPTAFRSPCWCHLSQRAIDMLSELGYVADSSATPQRLGIFSSTPFQNVWTFASRRMSFLSPTLVEIPTSTIFIPGGSPSFSILRRRASRLLVAALALEVRLLPARVLVLQFHANGFNPASSVHYASPKPLSLGDFLPQRNGGFAFKHRLRSGDSATLASVTNSVLDDLGPFACLTLTEIVTESGRDARSPSAVRQPA